jgi:uncharacterized membrane protein
MHGRPFALAGAATLMVAAASCSNTAPRAAADAGAAGSAALVCNVSAPTVCPDPPPHYGDVSGILQARCVPCHDDTPDAAWPLQTYEQVAEWADVVRDDLIRCTMPPADGGITIAEDERTAILTWIRCSYPE